MTPDCEDHTDTIPRDCAEAFGDLRERMARIETTVQEVRAHQQSTIRRAWEWAKIAAVFVGGWIVGK